MSPLKLVFGIVAIVLFAALTVCAIASEAWGRLRHGSDYESGGGLGSAEDYSR